MGLSLKIENLSSLPDGGPLGIDVPGKRGLDIGRDQYLDWTLPDPTRFISGKHCEVRFRDGAYWLHDVSTNGTFLNGGEERMTSPHRLRTGDRLEIGDYIVAVTVDLDDVAAERPVQAPKKPTYDDLWQVDENVAPPLKVEPQRMPRHDAPAPNDFLDHLIDSSGRMNDALWNDSGQSRQAAPPSPDLQTSGNQSPRFQSPRFQSSSLQSPSLRLDWETEGFAPVKQPPLPKTEFGAQSAFWDEFRAPAVPAPAAAPDPVVPRNAPASAIPPSPPMPPQMEQRPPQPAQRADTLSSVDFVRLVARGAGVHESAFASRTPEELAEELGQLLRLATSNLKQLLTARSELKDVVRSTAHTMLVAADNNPLKFSPTVEDAIAMMFAPATASYLDARRAMDESFNDLKQHQVQIFSAIQFAVGMLAKDFDPKIIEADTEVERGLGAMVSSRKAKFWDAYVSRWRIQVSRHEDGLLGVFLNYFSVCYDRASTQRRSK